MRILSLGLLAAAAAVVSVALPATAAVMPTMLQAAPGPSYPIGKGVSFGGVGTKALPAGQNGYANIDNIEASYANGFSAADGAAITTSLLADDITADAAGTVTQFAFTVINTATTPVTAQPLARFYENDGAGGLPGLLLGAYDFGEITFAPNTITIIPTGLLGDASFDTDGTFFAGLAFDNAGGLPGGATRATAADLDNLGQGLFDPPTTGASGNVLVRIDPPQGSYLADDPAGTSVFNFGDTGPVASTGWQIGISPVPEPASLSLLGLGGVALLRRRRA